MVPPLKRKCKRDPSSREIQGFTRVCGEFLPASAFFFVAVIALPSSFPSGVIGYSTLSVRAVPATGRAAQSSGGSPAGHRLNHQPVELGHRTLGFGREPLPYPGELSRAQIPINLDLHLGVEAVSDPPRPDRTNLFDAWNGGGAKLYGVHDLRFDRVHHPPPHRKGRVLDDEQDRDRYPQANQRVQDRVAERHPEGAHDDRERGEPVGPGVLTIRDERGATYPLADPNPELRHQLVAQKANHASDGDPPDIGDLRPVDELHSRLVSGDASGEEDQADYRNP